MEPPTPIKPQDKQYKYVLSCGLEVTLVERSRKLTKEEMPQTPPMVQQRWPVPMIVERTVRVRAGDGEHFQREVELSDPDVMVLLGLLQNWMVRGRPMYAPAGPAEFIGEQV